MGGMKPIHAYEMTESRAAKQQLNSVKIRKTEINNRPFPPGHVYTYPSIADDPRIPRGLGLLQAESNSDGTVFKVNYWSLGAILVGIWVLAKRIK